MAEFQNVMQSSKVRISKRTVSVLKYIQMNEQITQKEIVDSLDLPIRKIRYSLIKLIDLGLIEKIPNLEDMRSAYYKISKNVTVNLETIFDNGTILTV